MELDGVGWGTLCEKHVVGRIRSTVADAVSAGRPENTQVEMLRWSWMGKPGILGALGWVCALWCHQGEGHPGP